MEEQLKTANTDLEDLTAWGFVPIVSHVNASIRRGRTQAEYVAEDPHYSKQTLHLGLIITRQTKKGKRKKKIMQEQNAVMEELLWMRA